MDGRRAGTRRPTTANARRSAWVARPGHRVAAIGRGLRRRARTPAVQHLGRVDVRAARDAAGVRAVRRSECHRGQRPRRRPAGDARRRVVGGRWPAGRDRGLGGRRGGRYLRPTPCPACAALPRDLTTPSAVRPAGSGFVVAGTTTHLGGGRVGDRATASGRPARGSPWSRTAAAVFGRVDGASTSRARAWSAWSPGWTGGRLALWRLGARRAREHRRPARRPAGAGRRSPAVHVAGDWVAAATASGPAALAGARRRPRGRCDRRRRGRLVGGAGHAAARGSDAGSAAVGCTRRDGCPGRGAGSRYDQRADESARRPRHRFAGAEERPGSVGQGGG